MVRIIAGAIVSFTVIAAYADVAGSVAAVLGDVKIDSSTLGTSATAKLRMDVSAGDTISTGPSDRMKIFSEDEIELNILPGSQVKIIRYTSADTHRTAEIFLGSGKIRVILHQKYDDGFLIRTPIATGVVQGSDFVVEHGSLARISKIIAINGPIRFGRSTDDRNSVTVNSGQGSELKAKRPPSRPSDISKDELARVDRETKLEVMPPPNEKSKPASPAPAHGRKRRQIPPPAP